MRPNQPVFSLSDSLPARLAVQGDLFHATGPYLAKAVISPQLSTCYPAPLPPGNEPSLKHRQCGPRSHGRAKPSYLFRRRNLVRRLEQLRNTVQISGKETAIILDEKNKKIMPTSSSFGIKCPDNSRFYGGNSTGAFLGCCTIDPATTSNGLCPNESLRATTFNSAAYSSIPKQACAGPNIGAQWFVCAYTKPPFMGCCVAANACEKGCAPTDLRPAKLSSNVEDANVFLDGSSSVSASTASSSSAPTTPTASPSSTASAAASASNSAHQSMQPGTVAGLAVGTAAAVSAIALLIFWLLRRRRTPAPATHDYALPGSAPDSQCQTPAASAWTFDDRSAAYAEHLSYASLHQGSADGSRHSIPPEYSAMAKHSSAPSELPGSVTNSLFELHEETSPPLRSYGFAPR